VARSKKFVPVLIDVDKQGALAQKYGVEAIPTVVFTDAKGNVLTRARGYHEVKEFLTLMDEAAKKGKS
jgi:thioredoxin-related protein